LCAGVAGVEVKDLAIIASKQSKPNTDENGGPFSIGASVNPLAKVIEMIENIKKQVQEEHKDEAVIYDNFACFCKDKTERLVEHVHFHKKKIDTSSATIADSTAQLNDLKSDRLQRKADHTKMSSDFDDTTRRLREEEDTFAQVEADFRNNNNMVQQALEALRSTKDVANSAAFLQSPGIAKIKKELQVAEAMGMFEKNSKRKAAAASLLQGETSANQTAKGKQHGNPMESYSYHEGSNDIIDLVQEMLDQMQDLHKRRTADHNRVVTDLEDEIHALDVHIHTNLENIDRVEYSAEREKKKIAENRKVLIENNADMLDSEDVLKEVTNACQSRANEYYKRTHARRAEITALNAALVCLSNAHKGALGEAQSLLQGAPISKPKALPKPSHTEITEVKAKKAAEKVATAAKGKAVEKAGTKPLSFLQELRAQSDKASFLGPSYLTPEDRKKKALEVILSEGKRTKSVMLTAFVSNILPEDPFKKVKGLLEDLRWRLEKEEHAEVAKHVWCNEQLGKAEHQRDLYLEEAKIHSAEVLRLQASIESLKRDVAYYSRKSKEAADAMHQIYTDVAQLSKEQLKTMAVQKKARDEIREAIAILKAYYTQAAKATNSKRAWSTDLMQVDQAPPTQNENYRAERLRIREENERRANDEEVRDEDRQKRARKKIGDLEGDVPSLGRAGSLADALGLMEAIADDFDREINNIQGDLDKEHQELVETNKALLSQKMKADELVMLDKQDLNTAIVKHAQTLEQMQTDVNLLDDALKELETLKPTCIDTGMSYSDRVQKREDEMAALRKALCILGEPDTSGC